MKKLYFLNEEEKNRILNMHKDASKKQYLTENKSQVFESRELLTENPIKGLRNLFNWVADWWSKRGKSIDLNVPGIKMKNIDRIKKSFRNKYEDFIDDNDNLIVLVKVEGTPIGGGEFYDIKLYDIDEDIPWEEILENGKTPENLSIVMKKKDYEAIGGSNTKQLVYKDKKFKAYKEEVAGDLKKSKIGTNIEQIKAIIKRNEKLKRWLFGIGGVVGLYFMGKKIAYGIGYGVTWGVIEAGEGLSEGAEAVEQGAQDGAGMGLQAKEWIGNMCRLSYVIGGSLDNFFNNSIDLAKNKNTKLADYLKANIKIKDNIGDINEKYKDFANNKTICFWQVLYDEINDTSFFKKNVQEPINTIINIEKEAIKAVASGQDIKKQLDTKVFPDTSKNDEIFANFSKNCPCVFFAPTYVEHFKIRRGDEYDIVLGIGDYVYRNTDDGGCNKMKKDKFKKIFEDRKKFLNTEVPIKNIYDMPENGPGSAKWLEAETKNLEELKKMLDEQVTDSNLDCRKEWPTLLSGG